MAERMDPLLRISGTPPTSWTYFGNDVWLPEPIGPQIFPSGHAITAELTIPEGGAEMASSTALQRSVRFDPIKGISSISRPDTMKWRFLLPATMLAFS
ncbi:MAG: hypothetical protein ABI353_12395 [Isosphaeraceae bacterium]